MIIVGEPMGYISNLGKAAMGYRDRIAAAIFGTDEDIERAVRDARRHTRAYASSFGEQDLIKAGNDIKYVGFREALDKTRCARAGRIKIRLDAAMDRDINRKVALFMREAPERLQLAEYCGTSGPGELTWIMSSAEKIGYLSRELEIPVPEEVAGLVSIAREVGVELCDRMASEGYKDLAERYAAAAGMAG